MVPLHQQHAADVAMNNIKVVISALHMQTATCHRCNRKGHFSSKCFSKTVGPNSLAEVDAEAVFLDAVNNGEVSIWKVTLSIQNRHIEFKIDTGAAVTAINEETYKALQQPKLMLARKVLCGPARQSLEVL